MSTTLVLTHAREEKTVVHVILASLLESTIHNDYCRITDVAGEVRKMESCGVGVGE